MISYGHQSINQEDINAVVEVLKSEHLTQGTMVPKFEQAICDYTTSEYAVAVNSATSALHIACLALNLEKGDWLWTSPNTFVASANCGLYCGAQVDFIDIDDLINYCLCSSYLPYLSGSTFSKKYKGNRYIDGDIKYDYKNVNETNKIIIHRHIWGRKFKPNNYLYIDKEKSRELFELGWNDTEKNKKEIISKIVY